MLGKDCEENKDMTQDRPSSRRVQPQRAKTQSKSLSSIHHTNLCHQGNVLQAPKTSQLCPPRNCASVTNSVVLLGLTVAVLITLTIPPILALLLGLSGLGRAAEGDVVTVVGAIRVPWVCDDRVIISGLQKQYTRTGQPGIAGWFYLPYSVNFLSFLAQ